MSSEVLWDRDTNPNKELWGLQMTLNDDSTETYAESSCSCFFPFLWIQLDCHVGPEYERGEEPFGFPTAADGIWDVKLLQRLQ